MNYSTIKYHDVANGPGVRVSLFVSGCHHHCPGCFNPETWDFENGDVFTESVMEKIINALKPDYIKGLSLLGGEPLEYINQRGILPLVRRVKFMYPEKDIWCYTGYDFEKDIVNEMFTKWPETKELVSMIDVIVDGKFVEELKDLKLRFRGSSNQRIIDVKESLKQGTIMPWEDKGIH